MAAACQGVKSSHPVLTIAKEDFKTPPSPKATARARRRRVTIANPRPLSDEYHP